MYYYVVIKLFFEIYINIAEYNKNRKKSLGKPYK